MAISLFFAFLLALVTIFWDFIVENYVVLGAIATALAFFATAWAAWAAGKSAKEAMKAVKLTQDSLFEIRKGSFKQWLELLFEQHDSMHDEVQKVLDNDNDLKLKLNSNFLNRIFPNLAKQPVIIRYVNHILSILDFIDSDFYCSDIHLDERGIYIRQLSNRMNSDVKLTVAILGLNVFNNGTYNQRKLNFLLNRYDFFAREHFFKEALEKINFLDRYVNDIFKDFYRESIWEYARSNILNYEKEIINPLKSANKSQLRTNFSVLWSYNNLCRGYLRVAFDKLPQYIENEIRMILEDAPEKMKKLDDTICSYVGYDLSGVGFETIHLKQKSSITNLLKSYSLNNSKCNPNDVFLIKGSNKVYLHNLLNSIDEYKENTALIHLANTPQKECVIEEIMRVVNENIEYYKAELDLVNFKP
ncbi:hypothetical protein Q0A17_20715 [Citrobacter sp. S2-9]|uniref:Phage abortive infection protein n=1 Tax=Citrobacter enshiensis TaxID=2971264 RepID=A0ABT8PZG2_9ENTR|nr:hypothetical protein [Citrobacter enshiensis]MDN8601811.1 hypothetical protein [Citrobacter enshiensis]